MAIDYKNPLFSRERCELLQFVPLTHANWLSQFIKNLKTSNAQEAKHLINNLNDPSRDFAFHQKMATDYIGNIKDLVSEPASLRNSILLLQSKRGSVFKDEISKNPLGQILEPGFRVVFPNL